MPTVYKVLGQSRPSDTNNANLYTCPASTETIVSTLHVANVSVNDVTFRVFVRIDGATASESNAIAWDVPLAGNSIFAMTEGITLNASDVITVRSSLANAITFTLFGSEIS
jgi:hypothetical protein